MNKSMLLTDREWKEFYIGDLFTVRRPKARSEKSYIEGDTPFVASGDFNNGVVRCCEPTYGEILDSKNCITVSPVDGSTFYQPVDFLGRGGAGSSILILQSNNANCYVGLFLSRMIQQTSSKYSYGKMGNQVSIKREKIMLPINDKGEPDYDFMESFIKEQEHNKKQEYITYAKKMLFTLEYKEVVSLEDKEWKDFFITDIFNEIQRGKRLTKGNQTEGIKPYVSSSAMNNGVDNFIANNNGVREFVDCLSLANSGSVGASFYHPYAFVASDHITHLKATNHNKYTYLFISMLTSRLSDKYNFNREINDTRISRERIMLPINNQGKPDYEYMEQYIKNIMLQKYTDYLKYVKIID